MERSCNVEEEGRRIATIEHKRRAVGQVFLLRVEGLEDRARSGGAGGAGLARDGEGFAGVLQFRHPRIEGSDALRGQLTNPGAVVGAVEREQLADLVEGEAGRLGGADEPQPVDVRHAVAAHFAGGRAGSGSSPRR